VRSAVPAVDAGARRRLTARFGAGVQAWCDALPGVLVELAARWRFELGGQIPRGTMSAVYRCRLADGRPAVLKASPDRRRLADEAGALRGWRTRHSPAVHDFDEQRGVLLIEAVEPGTPLVVSAAHPSAEQVADLLAALHVAATGPYPTVRRRVDHLFDSSTTLYGRDPRLAAAVPPELHERGRHLATALAHEPGPAVLLHGDLTPGNILDGGARRGLVAIDPAPCLGDPAFDAVDLILWRAGDVPAIEARARRLASVAGLDAGRLLAWATAFAAMNALEIAARGDGPASPLLDLAGRAPEGRP
jgi:streptomycin 6-kinase